MRELNCLKKITGPLRLIQHNFTNSHYLLIILAERDTLFNFQLM